MAEDKELLQIEPRRHSSNVWWAIFLIFTGVILLLNNFGLLSFMIWEVLWKFWPLLLILAGLSRILGSSIISRVLMALITIIVLGVILTISIVSVNPSFEKELQKRLPWWPSYLKVPLPNDKPLKFMDARNQEVRLKSSFRG